MKKIIGIATKWIMKPSNTEKVVNGIEAVGKNKLNKKKVTLVVIAILALLALTGVISEETFIKLFKLVN